jgi:hypothetical protein
VTVPTGRYRYLHVVTDVTASAATPSVVMTIDALDTVSGKYYNLLTSAAFTGGTETRVLKIGPGLTAAANLAANDVIPSTLRITMTHGDADSITYSVGAHLF